MTLLSSKTTPLRYTFGVPLRPVGKRISDPDGRLRAQPGHTPAGTFNFSPVYMPSVGVPHRGIYQLNFRGLAGQWTRRGDFGLSDSLAPVYRASRFQMEHKVQLCAHRRQDR